MASILELQKKLASGEITSVELTKNCLNAIEAKDKEINAFVRVFGDEALVAAKASDDRRQVGATLGPIDGIPVAIKDNMSFKDHITSSGSNMLKDYVAPYDATVVQELKAAGAVIVGQANMDEFAMGSSTESSAFGPTKNPCDLSRVPGGSSGGSAAAVAAEMVPLAYGSDTGGSIRLPAAFCGVTGLKPTYGAVSRYGLLAMASSLDQIGPLGQSVDDVSFGFDAINAFDDHDSTSVVLEARTEVKVPEKIVFGLPKQFLTEGIDPRIKANVLATAEKLANLGHEIKEVDLPSLADALAIYYLIVPAEVSANFARYDGIRYGVAGQGAKPVVDTRTQGFGDEVKRRIMLGTFSLSSGYADAYYKKAQAARKVLTKEIDKIFDDVNLLLGPVCPVLPTKLGEKVNDPLAMYLMDIYTVPVNLAGLPGLSVPSGKIEEEGVMLPTACQLIGPKWSEQLLFTAGRLIEKIRNGES